MIEKIFGLGDFFLTFPVTRFQDPERPCPWTKYTKFVQIGRSSEFGVFNTGSSVLPVSCRVFQGIPGFFL